jgi:hypothetical protein
MSFLNISVPPFEAFIRAEFLRNMEDSHGVKLPCMVFGMASVPGSAPLFHFMMEDGGMWWRMPSHAFCWKDDAPDQELDELVLWDSFSYHVGVTQFAMLKNKKIQFVSRRREKYRGTYMFTLDWAHEDETMPNLGLSEYPSHHKCGHFIRMDNGNFAIQPNNRLTVHDPSFCTKPDQLVIHRKYSSTQWSAERNWRWVTPDTDIMEYDHTDLAAGESNESRSEMYNASDAPLVPDEDKV